MGMSRKQLAILAPSQRLKQPYMSMRQVIVTALYLQKKKYPRFILWPRKRDFFYFRTKKYQYHALSMVKNARPLVLIFAAGEPKLKALSWNSSCVFLTPRTPDREKLCNFK